MAEHSRRIVIAGAGGFGREVLAWLRTSPDYLRRTGVQEFAFINDVVPSVVPTEPILSSIASFSPTERDLLLCAIGDPRGRRDVIDHLTAIGAQFATFVHDSVVIGERVQIAEGAIVCPGAILTTDISVGAHSHININASIGHDVQIGEFTTISPACNIMGWANLGTDVFLGTAATITPSVSIGEGAIIGAGSIVLKDVEAHVTAFGNPCRVVHRHAQ